MKFIKYFWDEILSGILVFLLLNPISWIVIGVIIIYIFV